MHRRLRRRITGDPSVLARSLKLHSGNVSRPSNADSRKPDTSPETAPFNLRPGPSLVTGRCSRRCRSGPGGPHCQARLGARGKTVVTWSTAAIMPRQVHRGCMEPLGVTARRPSEAPAGGPAVVDTAAHARGPPEKNG